MFMVSLVTGAASDEDITHSGPSNADEGKEKIVPKKTNFYGNSLFFIVCK